MKKIGIIRQWRGCVFGAFLMVLSFNASALYYLELRQVVDGYTGCRWIDNGNGTSTIRVNFQYRSLPDLPAPFYSRGVLVYLYDAAGKLQPSSARANYVKMNGVKSVDNWQGNGYAMYNGYYRSGGVASGWDNKSAHTASVEVEFNNAVFQDWPAVTIRAGIYTAGDDVGEVAGGVYVDPTTNNACKVLKDPSVPPPGPPASLTVDVAAPDWNIGELPLGEGEKTLTGAEQQLCFTYSGLAGGSRNFVINATSANGILGNRYLLKNVSKPSQTIPYDLTLDSGSATFRLPNANASPVTLNNKSRTCFVPTFRTSVEMNTDAGDYSDVLSFTVVTKP